MKISPQHVLELYEKYGMKPVTKTFAVTEGCACPLGIIYFDDHFGIYDEGTKSCIYIVDKYGAHYVDGFYVGFDDTADSRTVWRDEDEKAGWLNGVAVREHLLKYYSF
jgi:hypothetical protein